MLAWDNSIPRLSFQSTWYQIVPTTGLAIRPKDAVTVRQYTDGKVSFTIRNKRVDTKLVAKQLYIRRTRHIVPTLSAA